MAHERRPTRANALRLAGATLAVGILLWTFRDTDPQRVAALLARVGVAGALLILLPQLLSLAVESLGWRMAFAGMGERLPFWGLLKVRIGSGCWSARRRCTSAYSACSAGPCWRGSRGT